jgi:TetR/AcrR family transcriptional regulator of autoinduction and epiphytic fitness
VISSAAGLNDKAIQILQGAMREFLRHGYAGTSMDKVAATAGYQNQRYTATFKIKKAYLKSWLNSWLGLVARA